MACAIIRPLSLRACSMEFEFCGVPVRLGFPFAAVLCILLVAFDLSIVGDLLAAIALHEGGHLLCAAGFGIRPRRISLTARGVGVAMDLDLTARGARFLIALAGPAVNLAACLAGAAGWRISGAGCWLEFAAVNGVAALVNLLPVPGLDGGDLLRLLLARLPAARTEKICLAVGGIALFPAAGVYFFLLLRGIAERRSLLAFAYLAVLLACDPESDSGTGG